MNDQVLIETTQAWLAEDPDPATRAATQDLLDRGDLVALREAFGARLEFGTAGLRGALGPGPNRMNRAIVRRVAAGLGDYLLATVPHAASHGVVVGYDGRRGSRDFAEDTACVLGGKGIKVWLHDDVCPTPQLGHAVTELEAAAGVMVTASHNPPGDNGYKVYWSNGAQIIPPHDKGISEAVDAVTGLGGVEVPEIAALRQRRLVRTVPSEVVETYVRKVRALRVHKENRLRIVYTALHGVGARLLETVLRVAGYSDLHFVAEQREPDGNFPTVAFPNPEEPGALDLALALAQKVKADIVVANDPDADRLAVAVPDGLGGFRSLTGNQVGVLLADDLLTHGEQWKGAPRLVATTIVSSTMLARIAESHGAAYAETLTGFKWIADRAIAFDAAGGHFVLGYEEALGYSAGPVVRDKDGVSAALLMCDLAAWCKADGTSVLEHLAGLYRRYGLYSGAQKSAVFPGIEGKARMAEMMTALRQEPPRSLGGVAVRRVRDVATGTGRDLDSGETFPLDLPRSNVLAYDLADGSRVLVRPSGTEPKIKFYFEVREPLGGDEPIGEAEARAATRVEAFVKDVMARVGM